jgi:branched-chain amino acid transport system permease protein
VVGAELLPVEPYYALRYMVTFLVVVSVGSAGSISGALAACLLLGAIDTAGRYLMPEFGEFFFYLAVIAIVWVFPRGLAGGRGA